MAAVRVSPGFAYNLALLKIESTKLNVLVTCCCSGLETTCTLVLIGLVLRLVRPPVLVVDGVVVIPLARSKIACTALLRVDVDWVFRLLSPIVEGVATIAGILNVGG